MKIIELASFELDEKLNIEDFLAISKKFQKDFVVKQQGFIERKLIRKETTWCDLVMWENMEFAENVSKNMGSSEIAKTYGTMIKPGSVKVEHYEIYQ